MSQWLKGKTVVLGVTGGIAAFKGAALCSKLVQAGADVRVVMTASAVKFIAPMTFQALSRHAVAVDTFDEQDASVIAHIDLADRADLVIVAPATANFMAKLALGLGDDMLTTLLLATRAPIVVCPAMNVHMYANPAVQYNMDTLAKRGIRFIEPGEGQLACGYVGKGRLAEPEEIMASIGRLFDTPKLLAGKKVLITAGGTIERIDPVRYLTNDSSGKMGFAIADAARELGADVTVIAARTSVEPPAGVKAVRVESAEQMLHAVLERCAQADIIIKSAAVADYRPLETADQKIKKHGETMTITLVRNPDILSRLGELKRPGQVLVGFAAETERLEENAQDKLRRKKCDFLVANDVSLEGAGFGTDTNIVRIYNEDGLVADLPQQTKREVAEKLLAIVYDRLQQEGVAKA
ncbi:bifunctional phosphopantothenoylcysteine decarboxylase/phosphopantothenate--cysteine ligase CoaBC [Paenibacillus sp. y28]|uniref:bifunctional phosphopantothenoylcysteine decarboxylase/phosphopantothenate--cysteine ligase CoaBC n=1 Tax=Paenibacillus sp. y28 TaxID=3129110 RepID=UPI00301B1473